MTIHFDFGKYHGKYHDLESEKPEKHLYLPPPFFLKKYTRSRSPKIMEYHGSNTEPEFLGRYLFGGKRLCDGHGALKV
jgi:hypothetical protein